MEYLSESRRNQRKDKVALISGITGQDGSYLTELLLNKGYEVHGIIRRSSSFNTGRLEHLYNDPIVQGHNFFLHYGDLTDSTNLNHMISEIKPTEVYNLGAQSHVQVSFELPEYTGNVDGLGTLRLLHAIQAAGLNDTCRMYQASTSELFGKVREIPQKETTPFYPRSPYAVAKIYGYWIVVNYREAYDAHASNGILFNHESPRRGPTFVTRKITRAVARIHEGLQKKLSLGNINSVRDWGHAKDYVDAMWRINQCEEADDYVVATGETHTVREFVEKSFAQLGHEIKWQGEGMDEKGIDKLGRVLVDIDKRYFRATEVDFLLGDATKAKERLGWEPTISFDDLCKEMVEFDLSLVKKGDLVS